MIGRFLSPDTWDPILTGVDINRYAYALNDPMNGGGGGGKSSGYEYKYSSLFGDFDVWKNADGTQTRISQIVQTALAYNGGLSVAFVEGLPKLAQRVLKPAEIMLALETRIKLVDPNVVRLVEVDFDALAIARAATIKNTVYLDDSIWSDDYSKTGWFSAVFGDRGREALFHELQHVADFQNNYSGEKGDNYDINIRSQKLPAWNHLTLEHRATLIHQYRDALDGWSNYTDYLGNPIYGVSKYESYIPK